MITIKRVLVADMFRSYKIFLDGTEIGKIRHGKSKDFPVQKGKHTLQLKIDWCTSNPVEFIYDNNPITFECGPGSASIIFDTNNYLWLRRLK